MELRQLRYFCAVADETNLTRAAETLGIRSPSLSQQVRALEQELGAPLFVRSAVGMALTAAGRALLPHARGALAAADRGVRAVEAAGRAPVLAFGIAVGTPPAVLLRLLDAARREGAELAFEDAASSTQIVRLRHHELDAGLVTLPVEAEDLTGIDLHSRDLGVLMAPGHPLAVGPMAGEPVAWLDLVDQELLWFRRELAPGYHDAALAECHAHGWRPRLRTAAARRSITLAELSSGAPCVALRPEPADGEEPGLVWRPLAPPAPQVGLGLVWRRDTPHPLVPRIAAGLRR